MLDWISDVSARRVERIQSLWSGYGEVFRVELDGGVARTAVVKRVAPPPGERGTASDARKRRSYDVEAAFYREFAPHCDEGCRVARLYASRIDHGEWWFVLEDLDAAGYSRRAPGGSGALEACLVETRYSPIAA